MNVFNNRFIWYSCFLVVDSQTTLSEPSGGPVGEAAESCGIYIGFSARSLAETDFTAIRMSSVRVDSPLLTEFRRQPSPREAPTMPKPRACRKLFPVDHVETDRFLQAKIAEIDAEQQAKMGIDLERGVLLQDQSSSRYTNWQEVPANCVPSVYRETVARSKPPASRLRLLELASNSARQNKNDSRIHASLSCIDEPDETPAVLGTHSTVGDSPFVPVHRFHSPDNSTANSAAVTTSPKPDEPSPSAVDEPNPSTSCNINNQRHGTESSVAKSTPSTCTPVVDKQLVVKQNTTQTQLKVTDYFRQRKRCRSDILPETESGDNHQVPTKRRVGTNSPIDGGAASPELGQS